MKILIYGMVFVIITVASMLATTDIVGGLLEEKKLTGADMDLLGGSSAMLLTSIILCGVTSWRRAGRSIPRDLVAGFAILTAVFQGVLFYVHGLDGVSGLGIMLAVALLACMIAVFTALLRIMGRIRTSRPGAGPWGTLPKPDGRDPR